MKKLKFMGVMAMATLLFTSCLDGGSNEDTQTLYAVVKNSDKSFRKVAYESDYYLPVYSPQFESLEDGQCILYSRKIVRDSEQNSSATEFYVADEVAYTKIDRGYAVPYLEDTATFSKNEMTILETGIGAYVKGMLFVLTSHPNAASDQSVQISLSYNRDQEVEEVNGERVYNIFVRAKKLSDGKNNTGNVAFTNAFPMSDFFSYTGNIEKKEGKDAVYFRFNYIKEFNKDSTSCTWDKSKVITYPIPQTNN